MKQSFSKKLALVFFVLFFAFVGAPVQTTFADHCKQNETLVPSYSDTGINEHTCQPNNPSGSGTPPSITSEYKKSDGAILSWITSTLVSIASWLVRTIILAPISWFLDQLLKLASLAFDFTVYFTIVKFRSNFGELRLDISGGTVGAGQIGSFVVGDSGGALIYYLWGVLRDFLNIVLFVIIIYHAVRSMFDGFEDTRKRFITLLVFSIVVNFSLLFVKVAIDVSNILALQAYTLGVKPSGTGDFLQFRTSSVPNGPASYGEFFKEKLDYSKLNTAVAVPNQNNQQVKNPDTDLKDTFMFDLGKILVQLGLIYILLYMTGLLLMRAGIFLFSMILASFIALDVFFDLFTKSDPGNKGNSFAQKIRDGITKHIKGDFYDALFKGPILIFFVFLIGVFASAIFGSAMSQEFTKITQSFGGKDGMPTALAQSLFVFMKFALFIVLCKITFDRLNEFSFGGTGRLGRAATPLANFVTGRSIGALSRATAILGQNTIGRGVRRLGLSEKFAKMSLNAGENLKNSNSRIGQLGYKALISIGDRGIRTSEFLKGATYDAGNTKTAGRLSTGIGKLTGANMEGAFGKTYTTGFEGREKAAQEAREKAANERNKRIGDALDKDLDNPQAQAEINGTKTSFAGVEMTLGAMSELVKKQKELLAGAENGNGATISGQTFSAAQIKSIFDEKSNPVSIGDAYNIEHGKKEEEMKEKGKKDFEKVMRQATATGKMTNTFDSLTPVGRTVSSEIQAKALSEIYSSSQSDSAKKGKTTAEFFSLGTGARQDLEDARKQVDIARQVTGISEEDKTRLDNLYNELDTALTTGTLADFEKNVVKNKNKSDLAGTLEKDFNLQKTIVTLKESVSSALSSVYESGEFKTALDNAKKDKKKAVARLEFLKGSKPPANDQLAVDTYLTNLETAQDRLDSLDEFIKSKETGTTLSTKLKEKAKTFREKTIDRAGPEKATDKGAAKT